MFLTFTQVTKFQKKYPDTTKYQFVEALQEIYILRYFKKYKGLWG